MSKLALIIKTKAKSGKRTEIRTLWQEHLKPRIVESKTQELYFFCEDDNEPDTFYLFEIYNDLEVFGANAKVRC